MDKQFANTLQTAHSLLKTKGAKTALISIKTFFEENQGAIKVYFDAKSLEETANEMKTRMAEIQTLVADLAKEKPDEVSMFLKGLNDFLQEEYEYRVKEVQGGN